METVRVTLRLYLRALQRAVRSFQQCWITAIAVVLFAIGMSLVITVAVSLGLLGGLLLGAANAFVVGWTLSLIEQGVLGSPRLGWKDVWGSAGHYFWDVISIGFIVWVPLQILEMGMQANPYGPAIVSTVFLLLFILLNPVPEVIYQGRHGSPLEVIKGSYDFIIENWIEWFLPLAIVLAPSGLTFFFSLTSQGGRLVGLDFFRVLQMPFATLTSWFHYLGVPASVASFFVLVLTPIATVFMLFFRGHLFADLYGSSRRQRMFQARAGRE